MINNALVEEMIKDAPIAIIGFDSNIKISYVNKHFIKLLGFDEDFALKQDLSYYLINSSDKSDFFDRIKLGITLYDEELVMKKIEEKAAAKQAVNIPQPAHGCGGCPGSRAMAIKRTNNSVGQSQTQAEPLTSELMQWPCQIKLVPVNAPYFDNCDLLIAADCTAFAYANIHKDFMMNRITLIGCPKLDEGDY